MMGTVPRLRWQYGSSSRVTAALLLGLVAVGCKAFDPVKSEHLCGQDGIISANCPQCQGDSPAENCPQCQEGDPSRCSPVMPRNPIEGAPDGVAGGPDEGSGSQQAGEDGSPSDRSSGGRGGQESGSGSDGRSDSSQAAGQGGKEAPPGPSEEEIEDMMPGCQSDGDCMRNFSADTPHCNTDGSTCEQCLTDDHCAGTMLKHCDPTSHRCEDCVSDGDCPSMACEEAQHICVECKLNEQCTDAMKNQCNLDSFKCVDCVDDVGCAAPTPACDVAMHSCFECLDDKGVDYCTDEVINTCDPATRTCVDCIDDSGCSKAGPDETCDTDNKACVDCYHGEGCLDSAKPVCDGETCVQCLDDRDCDSGHCYDKHCVECKVDDHCSSRSEARCSSSSHKCEPCGDNSDCEHLDGTTECDSGQCVECKDDSGGACGDYACLRDEKTCSDVRKGSVDVCRRCIADSVCKQGMKCVTLDFGGEAHGDFCVYTSGSSGNCGDRRPYSHYARATSIDGAGGGYCVPADTTTCEAVLDATSERDCSGGGSADCGASGVVDGSCNDNKRCTYSCDLPEDCLPGEMCLTNKTCG